jgi:hypothetical protein
VCLLAPSHPCVASGFRIRSRAWNRSRDCNYASDPADVRQSAC